MQLSILVDNLPDKRHEKNVISARKCKNYNIVIMKTTVFLEIVEIKIARRYVKL